MKHERLKDISGAVQRPLDRIDRLRGVYYNQNKIAEKYGYTENGKQIGLIAQEVKEVLPEVVTNAPFDVNKHGHSISGEKYMTVVYERLVPLLIEALKEQKEQIEYIKSKL